jgi:4-hydroxy-tetrahydrodipicolinate reductase
VGQHPSTDEIGFDSGSDTITLRHVARNRVCYARGALRAARWVVGKRGFLDFRDIFDQLQKEWTGSKIYLPVSSP